jgi:hypothetical protein
LRGFFEKLGVPGFFCLKCRQALGEFEICRVQRPIGCFTGGGGKNRANFAVRAGLLHFELISRHAGLLFLGFKSLTIEAVFFKIREHRGCGLENLGGIRSLDVEIFLKVTRFL